LVAVAVASTWSDHEEEPAGRKKSCQNVLRGSSRWPIGTVAHVPALVSTEVDSGVAIGAAVLTDGAPFGESWAAHAVVLSAARATPASPAIPRR
jgi:hypothetical protein